MRALSVARKRKKRSLWKPSHAICADHAATQRYTKCRTCACFQTNTSPWWNVTSAASASSIHAGSPGNSEVLSADYYQNEESASFARYLRKRFTQQARYLKEVEERPAQEAAGCGCLTENFHALWLRADGMSPVWRFPRPRYGSPNFLSSQRNSTRFLSMRLPMTRSLPGPCFEHVHDPMAYFQKASQVLKKGGLFVFQMPNL